MSSSIVRGFPFITTSTRNGLEDPGDVKHRTVLLIVLHISCLVFGGDHVGLLCLCSLLGSCFLSAHLAKCPFFLQKWHSQSLKLQCAARCFPPHLWHSWSLPIVDRVRSCLGCPTLWMVVELRCVAEAFEIPLSFCISVTS